MTYRLYPSSWRAVRILAAVCAALGASDGAAAQTTAPADDRQRNLFGLRAAPLDEPIVTDRPDFTESALSVPMGRVQLEGGYTFTFDREDDTRSRDHTFPEFLLRVGLVEDVELRIGWLGWLMTDELFVDQDDEGRTFTRKVRDNGNSDLNLGFKFHLLEQKAWIPEFGIIAAVNVPSGSTTKTSGDVDPEVKLLWSYVLNDRTSLSGNVNFLMPTTDASRLFQVASSISLGYGLTDRLGSYIEYFGTYPNDRDADGAHNLNGGFTYQLTDNLQFDIRAGFGLNEEAPDFFTGAGFAIRF